MKITDYVVKNSWRWILDNLMVSFVLHLTIYSKVKAVLYLSFGIVRTAHLCYHINSWLTKLTPQVPTILMKFNIWLYWIETACIQVLSLVISSFSVFTPMSQIPTPSFIRINVIDPRVNSLQWKYKHSIQPLEYFYETIHAICSCVKTWSKNDKSYLTICKYRTYYRLPNDLCVGADILLHFK